MKLKKFTNVSVVFVLVLAACNQCAYGMQESFATIAKEAGSTCSCKQAQAKLKAQRDSFKVSCKQRKEELELKKRDDKANYKKLKADLRLEKASVKGAYIQAKQDIAKKKCE